MLIGGVQWLDGELVQELVDVIPSRARRSSAPRRMLQRLSWR